MSYDHWRQRLAIAQKYSTVAERRAAIAALKINFSQPGEADEGYYRKPITVKDASGNGRNVVVGWIPVSYFMIDGKLVGSIGAAGAGRDMTDQEIGDEELWSYVVSNPIPYEWYSVVADHGDPWPDSDEAVAKQRLAEIEVHPGPERLPPLDPIERIIGRADNAPPELLPEVEHATVIDNAIGAAEDLMKVTTEEEAAQALGSKNRIAELRLKASKVGKAKYEPLHAAYVAEREKWLPMIARAEAVEKRLNTAALTFRDAERKRLAKIKADQLEAQRLQDEANARAADRAIAAGEPEPEPVVDELPPTPAPPAPIIPTYGKAKLREEEKTFLDAITDFEAVYRFFKNDPAVKSMLTTLAERAVKNGQTVPGTTTRRGLI